MYIYIYVHRMYLAVESLVGCPRSWSDHPQASPRAWHRAAPPPDGNRRIHGVHPGKKGGSNPWGDPHMGMGQNPGTPGEPQNSW